MTYTYQLIEAPSILGPKPLGVELLPYALQRNGFLKESPTPLLVPTEVTDFSDKRASKYDVLNADKIAEYTIQLAEVIGQVRAKKLFPVVLGGDCSILLGCMLALKKDGVYGLAHVDAHADFYQPEAEPYGEAASMDLALVVGRGPALLTDIHQLKPYVQENHVVQLGQRDADEADRAGSQRIEDSAIHCFDLAAIQSKGISAVLNEAIQQLTVTELAGYWVHFDVDVLADSIMPAVDYRIPGGISFDEATEILQSLLQTSKACGLSITIFNPKLDPTGKLTQQLVDCLHRALLINKT
ncbi:arginase family protein [Spirosoma sp. BT702]|uniref:Arginase family protein n=1 Tax=Spirosoma profusum TaxID=2771354 RepID=A0A927AUF7_9BACT|nr:arginase family protein [Spirosoma profusum]MBD2704067.1 arginase family protein [Spirosoma profusum]